MGDCRCAAGRIGGSAAGGGSARGDGDGRAARFTVPAGTQIPLKLAQGISTKSAKVGDAVYAETVFPVTANDRIVIPAGTYVQGRISEIKRPGRVKGRAEFLMHFTTMIFKSGYTVMLPGAVENVPGLGKAAVKDKEGTVQQDGTKGKDAEHGCQDGGRRRGGGLNRGSRRQGRGNWRRRRRCRRTGQRAADARTRRQPAAPEPACRSCWNGRWTWTGTRSGKYVAGSLVVSAGALATGYSTTAVRLSSHSFHSTRDSSSTAAHPFARLQRVAVRTIFSMAEDCARGERLGWQEFVRDYAPIARTLLDHFFPMLAPEMDTHVAAVFQRARANDNAWFQQLKFHNEREFLMAVPRTGIRLRPRGGARAGARSCRSSRCAPS